jgi:N-acetylglutamate synthase-like GNAT family acetyltransferase
VQVTGASQALAAPAGARPRVRAATLADVPALESFIARFTSDGTLLPRTRANLLSHLRDFRLARAGGEVVGCGALQLVNARLAEVRSVAVHPDWRGGGLGSRIVEVLLEDAARLGVTQAFCLTRRQHFFARLGFEPVPKEDFPHKVWNDCRVCPRLDSCDEVAMQRWLRPRPTVARHPSHTTAPRATGRPAVPGAAVQVLPSPRRGAAIEVRRRDPERGAEPAEREMGPGRDTAPERDTTPKRDATLERDTTPGMVRFRALVDLASEPPPSGSSR